jgi:hypothetical protein
MLFPLFPFPGIVAPVEKEELKTIEENNIFME